MRETRGIDPRFDLLDVRRIAFAQDALARIAGRKFQNISCKIDRIEDDSIRVNYPNGDFRITFSDGGELSLEDSSYCPEFGVKIPNKAVAYASSGCKTETEFQIEVL